MQVQVTQGRGGQTREAFNERKEKNPTHSFPCVRCGVEGEYWQTVVCNQAVLRK